jgi:hypothetical protein
MEEILLPARYQMTHKLVHQGGDLWTIEFDKKAYGNYRLIGFEGEHGVGGSVYALDPEGGPFLHVGQTIEGYTIKSITSNGIFELIKNNQNENN